jgi:hypothetical protein
MKEETENKELFSRFRSCKVIEVIKVEVNEGNGTSDNPIQRVCYLVDKKGNVLAKLGETKERKFVGGDEMFHID